MTEPDVALTDFGLTLQCAAFARVLLRNARHRLCLWGGLFFASLAMASCAGGIVHGFARDESTPAYAVLWRLTLLCMGAAALGLGGIAAARLDMAVPRWLIVPAAAYAVVAVAVTQTFFLAMVAYVPAAVFLLAACVRVRITEGDSAAALGAAAMLLTFFASLLQQLHVGLHPVYFGYNALYHLIEAVALAMLFVSLRRMARKNPSCIQR